MSAMQTRIPLQDLRASLEGYKGDIGGGSGKEMTNCEWRSSRKILSKREEKVEGGSHEERVKKKNISTRFMRDNGI